MKLLSTKPRTIRFAFIFALFCVAAFAYIEYSKRKFSGAEVIQKTPYDRIIGIGGCNSFEDCQRAAVRQLSWQVRSYPQVETFEIRWESEQMPNLFYDRDQNAMWQLFDKTPAVWKLTVKPPFLKREGKTVVHSLFADTNPIIKDNDIVYAAKHNMSLREMELRSKKLHP